MEDILQEKDRGATMIDEPCEIALVQCINNKDNFIILARAILKRGDSLDLGLPIRYISPLEYNDLQMNVMKDITSSLRYVNKRRII